MSIREYNIQLNQCAASAKWFNCHLLITLPGSARSLVASALLFISFSSKAQLHAPVSCSGSPSFGSLQWSSSPTGSSQYDWAPDGSLANASFGIRHLIKLENKSIEQ